MVSFARVGAFIETIRTKKKGGGGEERSTDIGAMMQLLDEIILTTVLGESTKHINH